MKKGITPLIERLAALRRSAFRQAAAQLDIALIHAEILEYLSNCNRYSNTPLAVVEYLGQTKGSVSQSLKRMEERQLLTRTASPEDKRSIRLELTTSGKNAWLQIEAHLPDLDTDDSNLQAALTQILKKQLISRNNTGFSVCQSCKFNEKIDESHFNCGLTNERLTLDDTFKICREHRFAQENS